MIGTDSQIMLIVDDDDRVARLYRLVGTRSDEILWLGHAKQTGLPTRSFIRARW